MITPNEQTPCCPLFPGEDSTGPMNEPEDDTTSQEFDDVDFAELMKPTYATGRRKSSRRTGLAGFDFCEPPKDIAQLAGSRDGRPHKYVKIDFADLAPLDSLQPKRKAAAWDVWLNLLSRQGLRKGAPTGVVRAGTQALRTPKPIGEYAVVDGIAALLECGLIQGFQTSRRESRIYVLVPVHLRFCGAAKPSPSPDHVKGLDDLDLDLSPDHVQGLSPDHVQLIRGSSADHVPPIRGVTTSTGRDSPPKSGRAPSESSLRADYAAAAAVAKGSALRASAAAADAAPGPDPTQRGTWDEQIGEGQYTWKETEDFCIIETKLFFDETDSNGKDRSHSLLVTWEVDKALKTSVVRFPKHQGSPRWAWEEVIKRSRAVWKKFSTNPEEEPAWGWSDFLVCMEKQLFNFIQRGQPIKTPVGWLDLVCKDILDKKWGLCLFDDQRFETPDELDS